MLRKRFIKGAKEHYSKEVWKEKYLKGLTGIGMTFGYGGVLGSLFSDSMIFTVMSGVGVLNMCQAYLHKRSMTNTIVETLDKRTSDLGYVELEKRIQENDFTVPPPSEEELQEYKMDSYSLRVMGSVAENEYRIRSYPWNAFGIGLAAYGAYKAMEEPMQGGVTMSVGATFFVVGSLVKSMKLAKVAKDASKFLKQKGYGFFDAYVSKKDPYSFYQRFMVGEKVKE